MGQEVIVSCTQHISHRLLSLSLSLTHTHTHMHSWLSIESVVQCMKTCLPEVDNCLQFLAFFLTGLTLTAPYTTNTSSGFLAHNTLNKHSVPLFTPSASDCTWVSIDHYVLAKEEVALGRVEMPCTWKKMDKKWKNHNITMNPTSTRKTTDTHTHIHTYAPIYLPTCIYTFTYLVYWTAQQWHALLSDRRVVFLYIYGMWSNSRSMFVYGNYLYVNDWTGFNHLHINSCHKQTWTKSDHVPYIYRNMFTLGIYMAKYLPNISNKTYQLLKC